MSGFTLGFRVLFTTFITVFGLMTAAQAETKYVRWVEQKDMTDDLKVILPKLSSETGLNLTLTDFALFESRELANYQFTTYLQVFNNVPVKNSLIRTWKNLSTGHLVQMQAHIEDSALTSARLSQLQLRKISRGNLKGYLDALPTSNYITEVLRSHDDRQIRKMSTQNMWVGSDLQQHITIKGRRGTHKIVVSHFAQKVISSEYEQYPQADLEALVYPIYEETEKARKMQERVPVTLSNLNSVRKDLQADPYAPLRNRRYFEDMIDVVKGETEEGRAQGYWSPGWLVKAARELFDATPSTQNDFSNGLFLEGKYVTVSLHPEVAKLKGINFPFAYSGHMNFTWRLSERNAGQEPAWEVIPASALRGRPFTSQKAALDRPAERLPNHDVVSYINSGFDEVQVYYAVDKLMLSLRHMGLTDPELSERPFHAYLYDTDISMRNNAYYTDDTINFTTYSPDNQNFARDNSTIWHELGHGIMDRLMGPILDLADSGGLSEGMADFIAKLVVEDVTDGQPFDGKEDFRIENKIGFHLTNESHDDGEAYGGAMNDILSQAIAKFGQAGVHKVTDLTLDAMRLARNHPALTANDWFEQMLFADELGHEGLREKGEMREMILSALQTRNFRLDRGQPAQFKILVGGQELTDSGTGSRYRPYKLTIARGKEKAFKLNLSLVSSDAYAFQYPVTVALNFNGSPLQGPARWKNEAKGDVKYVLKTPKDLLNTNIVVASGCDEVNREDGSCHDYTHIQVYNAGETRPIAKKRFYVQVSE